MNALFATDAPSRLMASAPDVLAWTSGVHDRADGGWWPVFPLLWLLFWVVLVGTVVTLWRRRGAGRSGESVLAERYARGEIDAAEYQDRLGVLRRRGRPRSSG